ncbi:MAG: hypothetical protein K8T90_19190 [Planctomycetes bacterium]|nr:hypothetical protein [Planctomycetota bacterium]
MSLEPDAPNRAAAASALKGPAIGMIVAASIGAVVSLFGLMQKPDDARAVYEMMKLPKEQVDQMMSMVGPLQKVMAIGFFLLNVFIIFGSLKMMKLSSYGLAMTACILAILDCNSCCCILAAPFAIWGLVVMNRAEVKASFQ